MHMACVPPRMILSKPRQFFNITPISQTGMTVVDLGDIDEGSEAPRSSSLPPTSVKLFEDLSRETRHSSLPRTTGPIRPLSRSTFEESEENAEELETGSHDSASDGTSSQGMPANNGEASLRSSHGAMIPRSMACIKKEKIKTCWFMLWNKKAITKPPVLHTNVQLELGDLFINQFHSKEHGAHVLQVWLLVAEGVSKKNLIWKQVRESLHGLVMPNSGAKVAKSEKVYHPKLKHHILSFQPSDTTTPTWILSNTDRRSRNMPQIVLG
ncbi:hypothetical protein EDB83DRAFT_2527147 [Lactarius deliciosus]|nr:hypothetical protein EDB83DRAFT_2527147 [Lactarius deliciosus]